jgi:hypothetical protein
MIVNGVYGFVALAIVVLATLAIGALGLRISRTTSDFYVASASIFQLHPFSVLPV